MTALFSKLKYETLRSARAGITRLSPFLVSYRVEVALFLGSFVLFWVGLGNLENFSFDEFHYVPAARSFLSLTEIKNLEHPPLGKVLIAIGMALFGDQPLGWRSMSVLFGAISLLGMTTLSRIWFRSEWIALWTGLITAANQLLFVQSRTAMLDTFMEAFLLWGLVAFFASLACYDTSYPLVSLTQVRRTSQRWLAVSGLCFGLAVACKWFAIVPWVTCLGLVLLFRLLQFWRVVFEEPQESDWYRTQDWMGLSGWTFIATLVVLPLLIYQLSFLIYLFFDENPYSIFDLLSVFAQMLHSQLNVITHHTYESSMLEWPLLHRPMWYSFDREGPQGEWVRGVFLIGNPLIMWTGLGAVFFCGLNWISKRDRVSFFILVLYSCLYFCWSVIPRKISFYYYYYPAGMTLSLALTRFFFKPVSASIQKDSLIDRNQRNTLGFFKILFQIAVKGRKILAWIFLILSILVFIYFYPILSGMKIPTSGFRLWMWSPRWI